MLANEQIKLSENDQFISKVIQMPSSYLDDWHKHPWHQIIFPISGLLQSKLRLKIESKIDNKSVIVPHNGVLYIPENTLHKSVAITDTQFMAVYLNPNIYVKKQIINYNEIYKTCALTPLLKALILQLFNKQTNKQSEVMKNNLLRVLRDQIELAGSYEIPLLIPRDRRLLSIFTQLQEQPDLAFTLADWAIKVGASQRTLSRLCAKEFNLSFSLWRQNIRLVLSLQLLEKQISIQSIAMDLGYHSDSAYIYAFKGLFIQTPNQYRQHALSHR